LLRNLRNYFITGLVVILPAILTLIILGYLVGKANELILEPINSIFMQNIRPLLPLATETQLFYLSYAVKVLIFILLLVLIALVGLTTKWLVIRKSFSAAESLFLRIPMVGKIYISIKQLSNAFLGQRRGIFEKVALLEYPRRGIYSIGLVISEAQQEVQAKTKQKMISVFLPTTPNPTSGVFLLVPEEELIYLDMSVEEGLKLVVSGGKVTPEYRKRMENEEE
jgi:uncharacterized membrane protein